MATVVSRKRDKFSKNPQVKLIFSMEIVSKTEHGQHKCKSLLPVLLYQHSMYCGKLYIFHNSHLLIKYEFCGLQ